MTTTGAALAQSVELVFRITGIAAGEPLSPGDLETLVMRMTTDWDTDPDIGEAPMFRCGSSLGSPGDTTCECPRFSDEIGEFRVYPDYGEDCVPAGVLGEFPFLFERRKTVQVAAGPTELGITLDLSPVQPGYWFDSQAQFSLLIDPAALLADPEAVGFEPRTVSTFSQGVCGFRHQGQEFPSTALCDHSSSPFCPTPTSGLQCVEECAYIDRDWEVCYTVELGCVGGGAEVCDGVDNDRDGLIDEGLPTAANPATEACVDANQCPSTRATWCQSGATVTSACSIRTDIPTEVDCVDSSGCARTAMVSCQGGAIVTTCPPPTDVDDSCNGVDDDCDGRFDEDYENFRHSCDPAEPARDCTGATAGTCCGTQTRFCRSGTERESACNAPANGPEIIDGKDNDCDHDIDECEPGQTDWWCQCITGDEEFEFAVTDAVDPLDPLLPPEQREVALDAAADLCVPGVSSPGCSLRGVFRRAEQLDYRGCTAIGRLPAGVFQIADELRLGAGNLRLLGADAAPDGCLDPTTCVPISTTITTLVPCTRGALQPSGALDCGCAAGGQSRHRLINAIASERERLTDDVDQQAGISLALELRALTLRGGVNSRGGSQLSREASGGVVIEKGSLVAERILVQDNRSAGLGSGIAAFDSGLVRIEESVIRDNYNTQSAAPTSVPGVGTLCRPVASAGGGATGAGGGLFLHRVTLAEVTRTAILGNTASDGGGIRAQSLGRLVITNCTIDDNHASGGGGGIWSSIDTTLLFNTISANEAPWAPSTIVPDCVETGGGIYQQGPGALTAFGNILTTNEGGGMNPDCHVVGPEEPNLPDCSPVLVPVAATVAALNLIQSVGARCEELTGAPGAIVGINALLAPMPDAPMTSVALVRALQPNSAAIEAYEPLGTPAPPCQDLTDGIDQRRYERLVARPSCSLGAYEPDAQPVELGPSRAVTGLFAGADLTVRDRARLESDATAGTFSIGHDAVVDGSVFSLGAGFLSDRAAILGDAKLASVLGGDHGGVHGSLLENAAVAVNALPIYPGSSGGPSLTVTNDGSQAIPPGTYGAILVRSRGTLELSGAGVFRFSSLIFEPDGFLNIADGDSEVVVAVDGNVVLGDRFQMAVGAESTLDSRHLFFYSNGGLVDYGHDSAIIGDLEAPFAHIEVRDRAFVRGAIRGHSVTIGFDTIVGPRAASAEAPEPPELPPQPPGTPFTGLLTVTGDWGSGYCAALVVTNQAATATSGWSVVLNMNNTTAYTTWNGNFAGSGAVTVTPGASWNTSVAPGTTNDTVGFCANRAVPTSGALASVESASAAY